MTQVLLGLVATSVVVLGMGQDVSAAAAAPASAMVTSVDGSFEAGPGLSTMVGPSAAYEVGVSPGGELLVQRVTTPGSTNPDDGTTQWTWSYTFSKELTDRLFEAVAAGASGTIAYICQLIAPPFVDPFCVWIAPVIYQFMKAVGDPNGRCLRITVSTKLGWPPVRVNVGYVSC